MYPGRISHCVTCPSCLWYLHEFWAEMAARVFPFKFFRSSFWNQLLQNHQVYKWCRRKGRKKGSQREKKHPHNMNSGSRLAFSFQLTVQSPLFSHGSCLSATASKGGNIHLTHTIQSSIFPAVIHFISIILALNWPLEAFLTVWVLSIAA